MTFGDERTANLGSVIGLLAAIAALLAALALVPRLFFHNDPAEQGDGSVHGYIPEVGQCYNGRLSEQDMIPQITSCDGPHYGEIIKRFELDGGTWPGQAEIFARARTECEKYLQQRFGTLTPVEEGVLETYTPREEGWLTGDRTAHCAIVGAGDGQLSRPLPEKDIGVREWMELKVGDCFSSDHRKATITTVLTDCSEPHTGQVTALPELENGLYPGDDVVERLAGDACDAATPKRLRESSELMHWRKPPSKESWNAGERTVICYITADGGELKRSLVDAKD
ncbi:septum formation family protein [Thermomonospora cellulosilytica]|uniref:Septum formation-related domain-containing protein n=1 Tax=Thermomonospora cellulosilytica TaxID=1411118 RepID=A0A7W3N3K8_9ACTN|nr:septum formation family protein [Thermomonospora cellulosilytica]MBA9006874.1 hypothetical protein [Thermomonospora cellulosilytica]